MTTTDWHLLCAHAGVYLAVFLALRLHSLCMHEACLPVAGRGMQRPAFTHQLLVESLHVYVFECAWSRMLLCVHENLRVHMIVQSKAAARDLTCIC